MDKIRALIIDDSSVMRKIIERSLRQAGIELERVVEAGNGAEALSALRQSPVDLILCDINMPVMDGLEFIRQMGSVEQAQGVPVVMITTEGSESHVVEALPGGYCDSRSLNYRETRRTEPRSLSGSEASSLIFGGVPACDAYEFSAAQCDPEAPTDAVVSRTGWHSVFTISTTVVPTIAAFASEWMWVGIVYPLTSANSCTKSILFTKMEGDLTTRPSARTKLPV